MTHEEEGERRARIRKCAESLKREIEGSPYDIQRDVMRLLLRICPELADTAKEPT